MLFGNHYGGVFGLGLMIIKNGEIVNVRFFMHSFLLMYLLGPWCNDQLMHQIRISILPKRKESEDISVRINAGKE